MAQWNPVLSFLLPGIFGACLPSAWVSAYPAEQDDSSTNQTGSGL